MPKFNYISNFGSTYRSQKPSKSDLNIAKKEKFAAKFVRADSPSLRALYTASSSRWVTQHQSNNQSNIAPQLIALLALSSINAPISIGLTKGNSSLPDSLSSVGNVVRWSDAPYGFCSADQHAQTSRPYGRHPASSRACPDADSTPRNAGQPSSTAKAAPPVIHAKTAKPPPRVGKLKSNHPESPRLKQQRPSVYQHLKRPIKHDPDLDSPTFLPAIRKSDTQPSARAAQPAKQPLQAPVSRHDNPLTNAPSHPPLSAAANSHPDSKQRGLIADTSNMLQGKSADTYLSSEGPVSGSWPFPGVSSDPGMSILRTDFEKTARLKAEKIQRENERLAQEQVLIENIEFNPFVDSFQTFIEEALGNLFEKERLPKEAMNQYIDAKYLDSRLIHAASAHLQAQQPKAIEHTGRWSINDIATGANLADIEIKAGPLTAHLNDVAYDWPSNFPRPVTQKLTNGWLWHIFAKFMDIRLTSGPLVDDAKKTIKAYVIEQYFENYTGDPAQSDAALTNFVEKAKPVFYLGEPVANLFLTPPVQAGTYGMLCSIGNLFAPIVVDNADFCLEGNALKELVKHGLPLKKVAAMGDGLFSKELTKQPFPRWVDPKLTFGREGRIEDVLWDAAIHKLRSDMDLNVLSSEEKNWIAVV